MATQLLRRTTLYGSLLLASIAGVIVAPTANADTPETKGVHHTVRLTNLGLSFSPKQITIEAGDTVTWVWDVGSVGTVTESVGYDTCTEKTAGFDSGLKLRGTFTQHFKWPGDYYYFSDPTCHLDTRGRVRVVP
jgi:plastocyanin